MAGGNPALPTYPLQSSVRLRSSASAFFTRTPTSVTNRRTFTWSGWVKRGIINTTSQYQSIFTAGTSTATASSLFYFGFWDTNGIRFSSGTAQLGITTAVFRDPSAWYHIVVAVDTTQATADNRIKLYVNGIQQTMTVTSLAQNDDTAVNNNVAHYIGQVISTQYFDGYLTEVNFIDGQALTPSSFGAYNSYGVWSPTKYTGSYGTNGFYLNFQDNSALTTTANIGIGADSSGNGNYWTSNNISLTAGVTYDSMLDVPTNSSATNANFAVLNPINAPFASATNTFSQGNLYVVMSATGANDCSATSTIGFSSGKIYYEATIVSRNNTYGYPCAVGITSNAQSTSSAFAATSYFYNSKTGEKLSNTGTFVAAAYGATYTNGDVIGVAFDADAGTLTFYKNGTSQGVAFTGIAANTWYLRIGSNDGCTVAANFGQRPFTYTPPTGFNRLNTYNLPDSIVPVGAQYMASTTYTGNGSTQSITNTVNGFSLQPDFVWMKSRGQAYGNVLEDSVRGVGKALYSNSTVAEDTGAYLTSFNSNGFSVNITPGVAVNQNADPLIGWQWRASNASAVTNTSGTITSSVSANQTAGFSVVAYTGNGISTATVGHGLGIQPAMVILKSRSLVNNWWVAHKGIPNSWLQLETTGAAGTGGGAGGAINYQSTFTSSVFGFLNGSSNVNNVNQNAATYVAYCFAAVPGYSAFGSYTGNGSADGPFVYLGFRPRWVMIKCSTSDFAGNAQWNIFDTSRSTSNTTLLRLFANSSAVEATTIGIDILSNGFKLRESSNAFNGSGATYIYAAFAENPFKNALAR
jgi:hypothetical protein